MAFHYGYPVLTSLMVSNFMGSLVALFASAWFGFFSTIVSEPLQPVANVTGNRTLQLKFEEEAYKVREVYLMSVSSSALLGLAGLAMLKLGADDLLLLLHRETLSGGRCPSALLLYRDRMELEYQYTLSVSSCPWLVKDPGGVYPVRCHRTLMFTDPEGKAGGRHGGGHYRAQRADYDTSEEEEEGEDGEVFLSLSRSTEDTSDVHFMDRKEMEEDKKKTKAKTSS